jgi:inosose dehydratase
LKRFSGAIMARLRLGNAPCSWGTLEFGETKAEQVGFGRMLNELVESDYTGTELGDWGYMPTDPAALKAELTSRGVVMLGAFVPVALKDPAAHEAGVALAVKTAGLLAAVAGDPKPYLVLADNNGRVPDRMRYAGRITPDLALSPADWSNFATGAKRVARAVRDTTGLETVFHHHCAGYIETPDEIARFLEVTEPQTVGLVFDTGHYAFGAREGNVIEGLERFKERVRYIHLKDCQPQVARRTRTEQFDYFQSLRHGVFCELGQGCVDFPAVLRWLKANRYDGYMLVEQDILPGMGAPKESARRNREYLRSIEHNFV